MNDLFHCFCRLTEKIPSKYFSVNAQLFSIKITTKKECFMIKRTSQRAKPALVRSLNRKLY